MFNKLAPWAILALTFMAGKSAAVVIDREGLPDTGLDTTNWVTGQLPPIADMWDLHDFQIAAKNRLEPRRYAYYRTGALNEVTYRANLNIWEQVRLNGFSFRDVSNVNLGTSILGFNFTAPFFIAPAATAGPTNPLGELSLATAAGKAGILYTPSISATRSLEEIAAVRLANQTMFHQEYIWDNRTQLLDELRRMENNGYKAIFLTVDNRGIAGIRTRSLRFTGIGGDSGHSATFDLDALAEIQTLTSLPVVPKGIRSAEDARHCMDLGFPAIYVSNHGGRNLDGAPTAVEILIDIRKNAPEVFERMEVYADGGVRRGNNVIALLALGARAVGLGRSPMFANIYGEAGVLRLIDMMMTELRTSMLLIGEPDVRNFDRSFVNTAWIENNYFL